MNKKMINVGVCMRYLYNTPHIICCGEKRSENRGGGLGFTPQLIACIATLKATVKKKLTRNGVFRALKAVFKANGQRMVNKTWKYTIEVKEMRGLYFQFLR